VFAVETLAWVQRGQVLNVHNRIAVLSVLQSGYWTKVTLTARPLAQVPQKVVMLQHAFPQYDREQAIKAKTVELDTSVVFDEDDDDEEDEL